MHSLLDTYLKEVAGHLSGLPAARRAEELHEVRTHLENAVIAGKKTGQTEDEAAQAALVQFGTPSETGGNLVRTWRREQMLNRRSLFGAAAFTVGALFFRNFVFVQLLLMPFMTSIAHSLGHRMTDAPFLAVFNWIFFGVAQIGPVLVGGLIATLFPRKFFAGAGIGLVVFSCGAWINLVNVAVNTYHVQLATLNFVGYARGNAETVLAVLLSAWAVSRLRKEGQKRRFQTAAK